MDQFEKESKKLNNEKARKKRVILTGIVICIFLILILAFMILYYQDKDKHTFKLYINDNIVETSDGFFYNNEAGETYVNAKLLANLIGWTYQNGEYGAYTEELTSGYMQSDYEIVSFVVGSDIIKKYINVTATAYVDEYGEEVQPFTANAENNTLETMTIELPIENSESGDIYFPLKSLDDICCCSVNFDNPYRMYIYNQKHLIRMAQINAASFGYQSISGIYENMRLLPYGMMVVSKGSLFGVVNLYNGQNIIGLKYTDMVFAQNTKEFFVKTYNNNEESIGIINIEGKQVVPPRNYSNIQVLSDELGLYLVEKNSEYGVLNQDGEVIVHCEYDEIGLSDELLENFEISSEDSKYILFDDIIVVKSDNKYGLYNLDGDQIFPPVLKGLGYLTSNDQNAVKNSENVLTIELENLNLSDGTTRDVNAIIISQEFDGVLKYGAYDALSNAEILPCAFDRIYSITSRGQTEYYIELDDQKIKFADQLIGDPSCFEK